MQYLLFRLYGPIVSWGDVAIGERRPGAEWPTKSAILGLLAATLGVRRGEADAQRRLREGLGFACRVDSPGDPFLDFHTAEVPSGVSVRQYVKRWGRPPATRREELQALREKDNPTLSFREYRVDALAAACVWRRNDDAHDLEELSEALQRPVFTPYLGRKSCVTALPFAPKIAEAPDPVSALKAVEFGDEALLGPLVKDERTLHWEGDPSAGGISRVKTIWRRDVPMDRVRWQFHEREEHFARYRVGKAEESV